LLHVFVLKSRSIKETCSRLGWSLTTALFDAGASPALPLPPPVTANVTVTLDFQPNITISYHMIHKILA